MGKYGIITSALLSANEHKFLDAVDRAQGGCWVWPKSLDKNGYGRFEFGYHGVLYRIRAHRAAYFFHTKHLPSPTDFICHHCDNPSCVNPDHLFSGDNQANMDDMNNKNRGRSKLTKADVVQIRELLRADVKLTYAEVAKLFGVKRPTIYLIANYASWSSFYVGLIPKRTKIDDQDRQKIKEMHKSGISARKIGNVFNVCHHTVLLVVRNQKRRSDAQSAL